MSQRKPIKTNANNNKHLVAMEAAELTDQAFLLVNELQGVVSELGTILKGISEDK